MLEGLDAVYAAEVARARHEDETAEHWSRAVAHLEWVLPWEEAYAAWRAAEALLVAGRGRRDAASAMLRRAHSLARRLDAAPLRLEVETLARAARVPLDPVPTPQPDEPDSRAVRARLTRREREVLDHVVAGRTYGEIARALFVSEKTVSSHVSNLLRKTGAANRVHLAQLASHPSSADHDA